MIINVGSKNPVKIEAVKECILDYPFLAKGKVVSVDVKSEVSEQPKSADETIRGAMNRAKSAFIDCDYSFALEDGLMEVPYTKSNYMNICACAIYDGKNFHLGLASAFEYPLKVTKLVFDEGLDINQAFFKTGLTLNPRIGSSEGAISILTHGRLSRKNHAKQAVAMALIHLDN